MGEKVVGGGHGDKQQAGTHLFNVSQVKTTFSDFTVYTEYTLQYTKPTN